MSLPLSGFCSPGVVAWWGSSLSGFHGLWVPALLGFWSLGFVSCGGLCHGGSVVPAFVSLGLNGHLGVRAGVYRAGQDFHACGVCAFEFGSGGGE